MAPAVPASSDTVCGAVPWRPHDNERFCVPSEKWRLFTGRVM